MIDASPQRHPALAALLSFVFPGLGQALGGRRGLALALAMPVTLLLATALIGVALAGAELRNLLLSDRFLAALVVLNLALLAWRVYAIAEAGSPLAASLRTRAKSAGSVAGILAVLVLLVATVAMHAWAGIVIGRLGDALEDIFSGGSVSRGLDPGGGVPHSAAPLNQPEYSWDGTERVSFLLLGVDTAPGREQSLTDTILVVSVDPVAHTAVMVSIPRDTGYAPLPDTRIYADGLYPRKINELATEAGASPELWCPDLPPTAGEACGVRSLERTVSLYLGIPIQYYAQVDLEGFSSLIDAVGGLTLRLPGRLIDPQYAGPGVEGRGIELPAGYSHYDGGRALAYARIRQGWIELPDGTRQQQDDFKRSERQQTVLLELRRELAKLDLIFELPDILDAVGRTVSTDFPRERAGDLASLLPRIGSGSIDRVVLGLPDYTDPPLDPEVNYLLIPHRGAIAEEMERLFGPGVRDAWYLSGQDGPPAEAGGR
ncbi:MAG TPA: LCP family protein [Candidatus Limnocylindria bacterium]